MGEPLLVIGNKNYSSWPLRVWLMLKHAGTEFYELCIPLQAEGYKEKLLVWDAGLEQEVIVSSETGV